MQLLDDVRLVFGQHVGTDLVDPEFSSHRLRGTLVVASRHDDAEALFVQRLQRVRRRLLDRIGDRHETGDFGPDDDEHHRFAFVTSSIGGLGELAAVEPQIGEKLCVAERH